MPKFLRRIHCWVQAIHLFKLGRVRKSMWIQKELNIVSKLRYFVFLITFGLTILLNLLHANYHRLLLLMAQQACSPQMALCPRLDSVLSCLPLQKYRSTGDRFVSDFDFRWTFLSSVANPESRYNCTSRDFIYISLCLFSFFFVSFFLFVSVFAFFYFQQHWEKVQLWCHNLRCNPSNNLAKCPVSNCTGLIFQPFNLEVLKRQIIAVCQNKARLSQARCINWARASPMVP